MKLLFDGNLSHHLVDALGELYPNSAHVRGVGLAQASDETVWYYAKLNDFAIVSKDADLHELSIVLGFPPKIIWIRKGNCSTATIRELLSKNYQEIESFLRDTDNSCLILR